MAMTGGTAKLVKTGTLNYGNYPATVKLYVYYKSTQDIANNSSTVSCGMYIVVTDGYHIGTWDDSGSYVGTTSNTFTKDVPYTGGTYWLAENKTFIVSHKSDGTGTATIYWKWGVNSPWGQMVTPSGSFTITLPTIARASSVSATNAYIGDKSTISIKRATDGFKHTLQYKISGQSSYTTMKDPDGNDYTRTAKISCPWTIPNEAYDYLSSTSKTVKITINCITYNGSTKIGSKTCVITATGRDSVLKPGTPTLTPTIVNDFNGIYIKGKSSIKLTSSKPTTKYGATIKSYIFTGPNIDGTSSTYTGTSASKTSSIIQSIGNLTYSVQVKDSRGILSSKQTIDDINVQDYSYPTIESVNFDWQTETDGTTSLIVTIVNTLYLTDGNAATIRSKIDNTSSTYSLLSQTASDSDNIRTTTTKHQYSGLDPATTGNIIVTVKDRVFPSKVITKTIKLLPLSRTINISQYGNGVAIGRMSSVNSSSATSKFECAWNIYASKGIGFDHSWNSSTNPGIFCQWKDGDNHDMITRYNDGLKMGVGYAGPVTIKNNDNTTTTYNTVLDIRPPIASARGELFTNSKTSRYDGKQGVCVSDNGRIYMTGNSNDTSTGQPGLAFAYNKSKKATSSIIETDSGYLTIKSSNDSQIVVSKNAVGMFCPGKNNAIDVNSSTIILEHDGATGIEIGANTSSKYVKSPIIYNTTRVADSPNMVVSSNGIIRRSSSSSRRYKTDIEEVYNEELDPYKILNIPVCQYKYNEYNIPANKEVDDLYIGLIAEDVAKEYPIAVEYNEDGQVEMWNIKVIVPAMLKIVQDQQKTIEKLNDEINNMKSEIENLKESIKNEA